MDFSKLYSDTTVLEVVNPANDEPIGLMIELRSPDSDEVKAVDRKIANLQMEFERKGKQPDVSKIEELGLQRLCAAIKSWDFGKDKDGKENTFEGEVPECSDEWKRKVLEAKVFGPVVAGQILQEIGDVKGFFGGSAKA